MKKKVIYAITLVLVLLCSSLFVACGESSATLKYMLINNAEYSVVGYEGDVPRSLEIPSSHNGKPVTTIGQGAFVATDIKELVLPNTIREIGNNAFANCYLLRDIVMSEAIEKIGENAFSGCGKIKCVTDKYCDYIGNHHNPYLVLYRANNKDYNYSTMHAGTRIIIDGAFKNCTRITSLSIPDSVVTIGNSAFQSCARLKKLTFGTASQLAYVGVNAFEGCTILEKVTLPKSLKQISKGAFQNCEGLVEINLAIDGELKSIGDFAFSCCSQLTLMEIPKSVMTIGENAFTFCRGLTSITFLKGTSLNSIGAYAFQHCTSLVNINYQANSSSWRKVGKGLMYLDRTLVENITCTDGLATK